MTTIAKSDSLAIDDRVCGGETAEDYDTGTVIAIDGDAVTVSWDSGVRTTQPASLLRRVEDDDLVACESADGWSLHAPGSTDDQIASGDAPPLASGPWEDDDHEIPASGYADARRAYRAAR